MAVAASASEGTLEQATSRAALLSLNGNIFMLHVSPLAHQGTTTTFVHSNTFGSAGSKCWILDHLRSDSLSTAGHGVRHCARRCIPPSSTLPAAACACTVIFSSWALSHQADTVHVQPFGSSLKTPISQLLRWPPRPAHFKDRCCSLPLCLGRGCRQHLCFYRKIVAVCEAQMAAGENMERKCAYACRHQARHIQPSKESLNTRHSLPPSSLVFLRPSQADQSRSFSTLMTLFRFSVRSVTFGTSSLSFFGPHRRMNTFASFAVISSWTKEVVLRKSWYQLCWVPVVTFLIISKSTFFLPPFSCSDPHLALMTCQGKKCTKTLCQH